MKRLYLHTVILALRAYIFVRLLAKRVRSDLEWLAFRVRYALHQRAR